MLYKKLFIWVLLISVLIFGNFSLMGETMSLSLKIDIKEQQFSVQEPIPIYLTLFNSGGKVDLPINLDEYDFSTYIVNDAKGAEVGRFTEYTGVGRSAKNRGKKSHRNMETFIFPSNKKIDWRVNLSSLTDLKQGDYSLTVLFEYKVEKIKVISNTLTFSVMKNNIVWLDVIKDGVAVSMEHALQQEQVNDVIKSIFHKSAYKTFKKYYKNIVSNQYGARTIISEVNFSDGSSFEYDKKRWLLWQKNISLYALTVTDEGESSVIRQYNLPDKTALMVGRPVRKHDWGLSIFIEAENSTALWRYEFDKALGFLEKNKLYDSEGKLQPLLTASTHYGETFILFAEQSHLPVKLIRSAVNKPPVITEIFSKSFLLKKGVYDPSVDKVSVLAVQPAVKVHDSGSQSLLAMLEIRQEDKRQFILLRTLLDLKQEKLQLNADSLVFKTLSLPDNITDEIFSGGDLLFNPQNELHGICYTQSGKVYYVNEHGTFKEVLTLDPELIESVHLVKDGDGDIILLYPEYGTGIEQITLAQALRR